MGNLDSGYLCLMAAIIKQAKTDVRYYNSKKRSTSYVNKKNADDAQRFFNSAWCEAMLECLRMHEQKIQAKYLGYEKNKVMY